VLQRSMQVRFRELIVSMRPTIARSCWVVTDKVDELTDAGLEAWSVVMTRLAGDLAQPALAGWASLELEAEHVRWRDASVILRTLLDYLEAGYPPLAEHDVAWYRNLRALDDRVLTGRAVFTAQDLVAARAAMHRANGAWPLVREGLAQLVVLPGTGPMPDFPPTGLVQPQTIRVLGPLLDIE
jgi:hypothetical protein